jgi:multiple sugar transport system ATP-binding protein
VPEGDVILGIRPESFEDAAFADASLPQLDVEVAVLEDLGADAHVLFTVDAPRVDAEELRDAREDEDAVLLAAAGTVFTARVDPRSGAAPGRTIRLAVDPSGFFWFDRATGARIAPPAAVPAETKA